MTEFDLPVEPTPPGPLLRLIRDQRVAYLVIGGINTVVAFGIFVLCSLTVGHLVDRRSGQLAGTLATGAIAYVINVMFAFVMHRRFVFRVRGQVLRDLVRFWSVNLVGSSINIAVVTALVALGVDRIPAAAVVTAATTLVSYFGHRHFSFRRVAPDPPDELGNRRA